MNLIDSLEALEAAAPGSARAARMKELDSERLRRLLFYALSPEITFGMKQVPTAPPSSRPLDDGMWWEYLLAILDMLAARDLTGQAAKDEVSKFLGTCSPVQQKWAERVIKQDLRLGINVSTVNKIFPGTIAEFEVPLAEQLKKLKSTKGRWALQPKFDGGRCVARIVDGMVTLLSRTKHVWGASFKPVLESIHRWASSINLPSRVYLDGEIVVVDRHGRMDFQATQRLFHTKEFRKPKNGGSLKYFVFDYAEGDEYTNPTLTYEERYNNLIEKFGKTYTECIAAVSSTIWVEDPQQDFLEATARKFVEELGTDGAIIRRADAIVRNKRTTDLVKIKLFQDAEATVVGKIEGTGWLAGSLGALECELDNGIKFNMGTGEGFGKELREELWNDPNLIGSRVNFKFLRYSNDGIPINITFRAIRHPNDM